MKRKYKIIIIISICILTTYLIYINSKMSKINFVAIGDGTSLSEDYNSFNDYIKNVYEDKKNLKVYNHIYSKKNLKIDDLIVKIENNIKDQNEIYNINQIVHKANLITICIGEEEMIKLAITGDLNFEYLKEYIIKYDKLLGSIKKISDAKIIVVGFYENNYLDKAKVIILNSELSNLAKKYSVIFINISDFLLDKSMYFDNDSYYFNSKAHKLISEMILNSI